MRKTMVRPTSFALFFWLVSTQTILAATVQTPGATSVVPKDFTLSKPSTLVDINRAVKLLALKKLASTTPAKTIAERPEVVKLATLPFPSTLTSGVKAPPRSKVLITGH